MNDATVSALCGQRLDNDVAESELFSKAITEVQQKNVISLLIDGSASASVISYASLDSSGIWTMFCRRFSRGDVVAHEEESLMLVGT